MSKQEEKEKFVKVPQVEIDGKLYHDSAEVSFGVTLDLFSEEIGGNKKVTRVYKLKKYVMVRGKVIEETVVRSEEGLSGREVIKNQLIIEMKKEVKRMDGNV